MPNEKAMLAASDSIDLKKFFYESDLTQE